MGEDAKEETRGKKEVSFLEAKREAVKDVRVKLHGSRKDLSCPCKVFMVGEMILGTSETQNMHVLEPLLS